MSTDPVMPEIVVTAMSDVAVVTTNADLRRAEFEACHSPDPWVRTMAWRDRWLASKLNKGTHYAYEKAFDSIMVVGEDQDVAPLGMGRHDIDRWVTVLRQFGNPSVVPPTPLSDSSVARYMATMSSYYKYVLRWPCADPECPLKGAKDERGCMAPWLYRNPVPDGDARPRARTDSPQQYLTPLQVRAVVEESVRRGTQAAALMALLANCLRISEAVGALIENIGEDRGYKTLTVIGKRRKLRRIAILPPAWRAIEAAMGDRTSGFILCGPRGGQMDRSDAWELVKDMSRAVGIENSVGPHTYRHAAISHALAAGVPLADVQNWAGHADSRTTKRYDRREDDPSQSPAHRLVADYFGGQQ